MEMRTSEGQLVLDICRLGQRGPVEINQTCPEERRCRMLRRQEAVGGEQPPCLCKDSLDGD